MPRLADLKSGECRRRLEGPGLRVRIGPFAFQIKTQFAPLAEQIERMYAYYEVLDDDEFVDLHVTVVTRRQLSWKFEKEVQFVVDGRTPFEAFPEDQALAVLEWGINFVIAMRSNHLLMLHSAIIERNGGAMLLPAWPGHGKSTLCSALVHRGWRLFSDEFGLVKPGSVDFVPFPRLVPLKNESIQVIKEFAPDAVLGRRILNTRKGDVAHVRPPRDSIERSHQAAPAKWIVFPRWRAGVPLKLQPMASPKAFLMLASNAFNYEVIGEAGFRTVNRLIRSCRCYRLTYSDLEHAVGALDELAVSNG